MVCAISALSNLESPAGAVEPIVARFNGSSELFCGDLRQDRGEATWTVACETADGEDPFDDFEDDDFDDEFDDDFEEDWEDDLTEDDEFPDTFGGADPEEEVKEADDEDSPFADDPDFDEA